MTMSVPHALLQILSLLYLASILPFALSLNEQDTWPGIWRETRRRWLKLMGFLVGIGAATMLLTLVAGLL